MTTKKRANGTGSIFRTTANGVQVWCSQIYIVDSQGKRKAIRGYGPTKTTASARMRANLVKGLQPTEATTPKVRFKGPTVKEFLEVWMNYQLGRINEESQRKYRRDIENHILKFIGSKKVTELTPEMLRELFHGEQLRGIGDSAREHTYTNFNSMLNFAVKKGIIQRNPLKDVSVPKAVSKVSEDDDRFINRRVSISRYLLDWLEDEKNPYHDDYPRILFMFLGLRRAELLGLEWKCVNQLGTKGKATIVIKQQLKRHENGGGWFIKSGTKNGKDRVIYLPERWRKALVEEKKKDRKAREEWEQDLIFKTARGTHISYNTHSKRWVTILTAYINNKRKQPKPLTTEEYFRPHAARHICASVLFREGVQLEQVQDILGHSDKAMTLYYTHIMKETRAEAATALETGMNKDR